MSNGLTVKALRAPVEKGEPDEWLTDGAVRGSGALWARRGRRGVSFYFRYSHGAQKKALPVGAWAEDGRGGLTLAQARERAAELSRIYRDGVTDLHGHLARTRAAEEQAARDAEDAARRAEADRQRGTLRQLIEAYLGHLERQGKQSLRDARSILTRHVLEAAPDLAQRKAAELTADDLVGLVGKLVDNGKGRTAAKARAYLRAAYQLAIRSPTDPDAPLTMRTFGITANPVAAIGALARFSRVRDRALTAAELGAFLQTLEALEPSPQKDALRLLLLLGGQRPAQLLRLRPRDVDLTAATAVLRDPKGARSQPRRHVLPLLPAARAILEGRLAQTIGDAPLFSSDHGATATRIETLSVAVSGISAVLVKAGKSREPFQLRDIRRTCETMLASLGVSSDIRAQLQSHGLGGVQQRHYDRHDYGAEKLAALETLDRHLATLRAATK